MIAVVEESEHQLSLTPRLRGVDERSESASRVSTVFRNRGRTSGPFGEKPLKGFCSALIAGSELKLGVNERNTARTRQGRGSFFVLLVLLSVTVQFAHAQTNLNTNSQSPASTNNDISTPSSAARSEEIRATCVEGRRYICGKVMQIVPEGLVVDSGYADLLNPPLNKSWIVPGAASLTRNPAAIEEKKSDAICIGLVFVTAFPKKPKVNEYDYVTLHVYPCGEYRYTPVPGVEKKIRRFSGSLELAVKLNLQKSEAGLRQPR
jgi:hypothetical protein